MPPLSTAGIPRQTTGSPTNQATPLPCDIPASLSNLSLPIPIHQDSHPLQALANHYTLRRRVVGWGRHFSKPTLPSKSPRNLFFSLYPKNLSSQELHTPMCGGTCLYGKGAPNSTASLDWKGSSLCVYVCLYVCMCVCLSLVVQRTPSRYYGRRRGASGAMPDGRRDLPVCGDRSAGAGGMRRDTCPNGSGRKSTS